MNTCDTCKHWQPTLGRENSDPNSTWGICEQIVAKSFFGFVAIGERTGDERKDPKPMTPKSFGCIHHAEGLPPIAFAVRCQRCGNLNTLKEPVERASYATTNTLSTPRLWSRPVRHRWRMEETNGVTQ